MSENCTSGNETLCKPSKGSTDFALQIDQMLCLNLRGRDVICTRCADICSTNALQLTADNVNLDAQQCSACGGCLPVCPSGALRPIGFDPREFLQSLSGTAEIDIYCSQIEHPDTANIVPCLQILDARLLAAAAADGARTLMLHGVDQCANCARGDARVAVERMRVELKKWFIDLPVHLITGSQMRTETPREVCFDEDRVQLSRRNFLRFATAEAVLGTSKLFVDDAQERDEVSVQQANFQIDAGFNRPSIYQELLAERAKSLPWRDHQLPWRRRVFSDACNACLICAQHCPTGALVAEETKSTVAIWFSLRACTDCGLCERLCSESAISCSEVVSVEELSAPAFRVMHHSLNRCVNCARSFVSKGENSVELCGTCQNERDLANDWRAMLIGS